MIIKRENVHQSDLILGAIYEGGPSLSDEPIHDLLGTQNMKGIRPKNDKDGRTVFIALHSNSNESEWPDFLDESAGTYTYFGDNRDNYKDLLDTDGNKALHRVFNGDFDTEKGRMLIPPFFVFSSVTGIASRSVKFEGLAVPGYHGPQEDWCVAKFFKSSGTKFQNYQIKLTLLADKRIKREWILDLLQGEPLSTNCPEWYSEWVETGIRIPFVSR
jgi:hypothetical protein